MNARAKNLIVLAISAVASIPAFCLLLAPSPSAAAPASREGAVEVGEVTVVRVASVEVPLPGAVVPGAPIARKVPAPSKGARPCRGIPVRVGTTRDLEMGSGTVSAWETGCLPVR